MIQIIFCFAQVMLLPYSLQEIFLCTVLFTTLCSLTFPSESQILTRYTWHYSSLFWRKRWNNFSFRFCLSHLWGWELKHKGGRLLNWQQYSSQSFHILTCMVTMASYISSWMGLWKIGISILKGLKLFLTVQLMNSFCKQNNHSGVEFAKVLTVCKVEIPWQTHRHFRSGSCEVIQDACW